MDIILKAMKKSIVHLQIIDSVFSTSEYPEKDIYLKLKEEIQELDNVFPSNRFTEEFYVGGKKRNTRAQNGFSRQMILSDIIQYIINGRGYFYAIKSKEAMKAYIKIILNLLTQLMIFDSCVVEVELRNRILKELTKSLGSDLYKNEENKKQYEALLIHDSYVGFPIKEPSINPEVLAKLGLNDTEINKALKNLGNYYDSLFPKILGLWGEILVYLYLLRKNLGFIFPLLLNQRLLSGNHKVFLKPPDFLLQPFGKEGYFGIEVGAGKDIQSGDFSIITGIPTATKANTDNPKRCCICGKWMIFCPKVINEYSDIDFKIEDFEKPIKCIEDCVYFTKEEILNGNCPYAMHKGGNPKNVIMKMTGSRYHFHLKCMLNDPNGKNQINESKILIYYPYVIGLENFENINIDVDLIDQKIDKLKKLISEIHRSKTSE